MRTREERSYTLGIPNNTGPAALAQRLNLSDSRGPRSVQAWIGNFGSTNVYLFDGSYSLAQCQQLLEQGLIDCLMALSYSGPTTVRLPDDCRIITVFFETENVSGQFQAITMRILREHNEQS